MISNNVSRETFRLTGNTEPGLVIAPVYFIERVYKMKMYYLLLDPSFNPPIKTFWHGDNTESDFLTKLRGFVIPLGKNKPKNISRKTSDGYVLPGKIYEF